MYFAENAVLLAVFRFLAGIAAGKQKIPLLIQVNSTSQLQEVFSQSFPFS